MSALSFEDVTVRLGGRDVLHHTQFEIEPGEFVGLLGANGAGKTTLLRAALGLLPLRAGVISVLGRPAARGLAGVGYMPQTRAAFAGARLTGRTMIETAAMGARFGFARMDAATRRDVDTALDLVDARDLAKSPVADLSGGQRQRLLLAQALLGQPKLLLLDEPLISLDPAQQSAVVAMVGRLRSELGVAVLFSAHELNPLMSHIDRVLYLGAGAAAIGTVDQVVTSATLSRLYGAEVEVVRVGARVFVMAGGVEVDAHAHQHDHSHA